ATAVGGQQCWPRRRDTRCSSSSANTSITFARPARPVTSTRTQRDISAKSRQRWLSHWQFIAQLTVWPWELDRERLRRKRPSGHYSLRSAFTRFRKVLRWAVF